MWWWVGGGGGLPVLLQVDNMLENKAIKRVIGIPELGAFILFSFLPFSLSFSHSH